MCSATKLSRVETSHEVVEHLAGFVKVVVGEAELENIWHAHDDIHFTLSVADARVDFFLGFSASFFEPFPQLFNRWRQDCNKVGVREGFAKLNRALDVDIEQRDLFFALDLKYLLLCRSIHIGMHLAVLDEFVLGNHLFKGAHVHEVVVLAIHFSRAWTSRRVGDAEPETVWVAFLDQALDDGAFANA